MIRGFYIKQLQVTGVGKKDAIIEFEKGLNIVSGPSDTGKSYLLQCISYLMGGDIPPKNVEESKGYDTIWMEICTYTGDSYTLKRELNSPKIVMAKNRLPEAKTSTLVQTLNSRHDSNKENNISIFLLNLTRLFSKQLKESRHKKRPIRFSDVKTIFIKNEKEVISEKSPISTGQHNSATVEESLFNLLLSGEDDEELALTDDPKIYKNKLRGKLELTEKLLKAENEKIGVLENRISKIDQREIMTKIEELTVHITKSNNRIEKQESKRKNIIREINSVDQHIIHLTELLSRFSLLSEHYASDLQRLEFMLEGDYLLSQLPTIPCPTCGHDVEPNMIKDFLEKDGNRIIDSILMEMAKIEVKKEELSTTNQDICTEIANYNLLKEKLQDDLKNISDLIEKNLLPTHQILSTSLEEYTSLMQNIARLQDAKTNEAHYKAEIEEYKLKIKKKPETHQLRTLPDEHYIKFCELIKEQLVSWGITVESLQFDKKGMDFIINGKARQNYGKGYRAILCSAFLISLMRYCWEQETYHPRTLIIDSPLTTYREGDKSQKSDEIEAVVQNNFYNSLANISPDFQIIILDNKDPSKDIVDKITYHHFTRNHKFGRYGFFPVESNS
jgi:hypothetical protein